MDLILDNEYKELLKEIKEKIRSAQIRAAVSVNTEVIKLYWDIGKRIIERQQKAKWGDKFLENLSHDLKNSFPETQGFSVTNLKRMRKFANCYHEMAIGAQSVHQLPWSQIILLIERLNGKSEREWYSNKSLEEGWSRETLEKAMKTNLYDRQGKSEKKSTNYLQKLPYPQGALAQEIIKNPYNLDFLELHDVAIEREIEHGLIKHIQKFLLELGKGFAFIGSQVPIEVGGDEFFIDLLFYHVHLHAYVVVELKSTKFKPEHAGQLNFYLTAVDKNFKKDLDNPSIGILLCKSRNKIIAEYALQDVNKPIGVSEYKLTEAIPEDFKSTLPSIEEIEEELSYLEEKK